MKHRSIKLDKNRYLQLNELVSKYNMSFSGHDVLGNKIMGMDGIKKKLLILEETNDHSHSYLVDLDTVAAITVKKIYNSIKAGELKKRKIAEFLKTIQLQFEFSNGKEDLVLPFYESTTDNISELPGLERKIKNWQMILSKMMGAKDEKLVTEKREIRIADKKIF